MFKTPSARLFGTLLGYVVLIILLLTLNPFYFSMPEEIAFNFYTGRSNMINNILLFLPVGFLYRLTTRKRGALVFGAGLSLGIETAQFFIPARTPSIPDILANAVGAGLGALFCDLLSTRTFITRGMLGRLRLETPLMGLIYLFVPLLWINMIALGEAPQRWLLTLLLGMCGAIIFSSLFRHWWKSMDLRIVSYATLASGSWFLIGVGPTLLPPVPILIIGFGTMVFTALLTILPQSSVDRRFERNTLRLLLPTFVLNVLLPNAFLSCSSPWQTGTQWFGPHPTPLKDTNFSNSL